MGSVNTTKLIRALARDVGDLRRRDLFEDLVQVGELTLFLAAKSWRADSGASLWTYARRSVLRDMLRFASSELAEPANPKHRNDQGQGLYGAYCIEEEMIDECADGPEELAKVSEQIAILKELCSSLSEDHRDILRARLVDDLDVRTAAAELGLSKSEADRRYHSAVAALREGFAPWSN